TGILRLAFEHAFESEDTDDSVDHSRSTNDSHSDRVLRAVIHGHARLAPDGTRGPRPAHFAHGKPVRAVDLARAHCAGHDRRDPDYWGARARAAELRLSRQDAHARYGCVDHAARTAPHQDERRVLGDASDGGQTDRIRVATAVDWNRQR